jgi:hypothetical protein
MDMLDSNTGIFDSWFPKQYIGVRGDKSSIILYGIYFIKTSIFGNPWLQPRGGENGCPQAG